MALSHQPLVVANEVAVGYLDVIIASSSSCPPCSALLIRLPRSLARPLFQIKASSSSSSVEVKTESGTLQFVRRRRFHNRLSIRWENAILDFFIPAPPLPPSRVQNANARTDDSHKYYQNP